MPELVPITNNFFVNLITRLGLKPPPSLGWSMATVVTPVSIVDSDITLSAISTTQLLDTPFTAGVQAAPVINTVLADSGAQNAGNYFVTLMMSCSEGITNNTLALQRRDAANAANIWEQRFYTLLNTVDSTRMVMNCQVKLSQNERLRILNLVAGGAGSVYHVNLWMLPS